MEDKTATYEIGDDFRLGVNSVKAAKKVLLSSHSDLGRDWGSDVDSEDDRFSFQYSEETPQPLQSPDRDSDVQTFWEDERRTSSTAKALSLDTDGPVTPPSTSRATRTDHQFRQDNESRFTTPKPRFSFHYSDEDSPLSEETPQPLQSPERDSDVRKFWEDERRTSNAAKTLSFDTDGPVTPPRTSRTITTDHQLNESRFIAPKSRFSFYSFDEDSPPSEETPLGLEYPERYIDVQKFREDLRRISNAAKTLSLAAGDPVTPAPTSRTIKTDHQSPNDHELRVSTRKSRIRSRAEMRASADRKFIIPRQVTTTNEIRKGPRSFLPKLKRAGLEQEDEVIDGLNPDSGTQPPSTPIRRNAFAEETAESQINLPDDVSAPSSDMVVTPGQEDMRSSSSGTTASGLGDITGEQISGHNQQASPSAASDAATADSEEFYSAERFPKYSWSNLPERLQSLRDYWAQTKDPNYTVPLKVFKPVENKANSSKPRMDGPPQMQG
jgi:hypothetical protein